MAVFFANVISDATSDVFAYNCKAALRSFVIVALALSIAFANLVSAAATLFAVAKFIFSTCATAALTAAFLACAISSATAELVMNPLELTSARASFLTVLFAVSIAELKVDGIT